MLCTRVHCGAWELTHLQEVTQLLGLCIGVSSFCDVHLSATFLIFRTGGLSQACMGFALGTPPSPNPLPSRPSYAAGVVAGREQRCSVALVVRKLVVTVLGLALWSSEPEVWHPLSHTLCLKGSKENERMYGKGH